MQLGNIFLATHFLGSFSEDDDDDYAAASNSYDNNSDMNAISFEKGNFFSLSRFPVGDFGYFLLPFPTTFGLAAPSACFPYYSMGRTLERGGCC